MIVKCGHCKIDFEKNSWLIKEGKRNFCSRSCSAKETNKIAKRKKISNYCVKCGKEALRKRKYCFSCFKSNKIDWSKITYGKTKNKRNYQIHSRIRELARNIYKKSDRPKYCIKCGYNKHYEVCHIKPINSFCDDSLISEINHLDNLLALCPNCHWEFDNLNSTQVVAPPEVASGTFL